jgi:hypothetical protein
LRNSENGALRHFAAINLLDQLPHTGIEHFPRVIVVSIRRRILVVGMAHKSERVELEMKILRYRQLQRQIATDPGTIERIRDLIAELEQKLRAIDE